MVKRIFSNHLDDRGFTVIEFVVATTILMVVIAGISPAVVGLVKHAAGKTAAKEMRVVSDSAHAYFQTTRSFPADVSSLASFIPGWNGQNKYGNGYAFTVTGNGLEMRASYPTEVAAGAARALPFAWTEGAGATLTLAMFLPRPARDPNLADLQTRIADMTVNPPIPVGTIILWDQSGSCPARFARVGAYDGMLLAGAASVGTGGGSHSHGISGHTHSGAPDHDHGWSGWVNPDGAGNFQIDANDEGSDCTSNCAGVQPWCNFYWVSQSGHTHGIWGGTDWGGGGSTDGGSGGTNSVTAYPPYRTTLLCSFTG